MTTALRPDSPRHRRGLRWPTLLAFAAPAIVLYSVFVLYPILQGARYSLYDWNGLEPLDNFIGLDNFTRAFRDDDFRDALRHNIVIVVLSLVIQIPVALGLATLLNSRIKGRAAMRTLFFAPYVLSEVVTAIVWRQILRPNGLVNHLLGSVGLDSWQRIWIDEPKYVLWSLFFVISWKYFGFHMILLLAGLQQIPHSLHEAAAIDGASAWQRFRYVTLPLLTPTISVSVFLSVIGALQLFDLVQVTTKGGPIGSSSTMATFLYERFGDRLLGYASAVSVIIFGLSLLVAIPYQRSAVRNANEPSGGGLRRLAVFGVLLAVLLGIVTPRLLIALVALGALALGIGQLYRRRPRRAAGARAHRPVLRRILPYVIALTVLALIIVPILFAVFGGFRTNRQLIEDPAGMPDPWVWGNYSSILQSGTFWRQVFNSVLIAVLTVSFVIPAASMVAFVLARYRFRGRESMYGAFTLGLLFPVAVAVIPLFIVLRQMHLLGNPLGVALPQAAFQLPLAIVIMRPFLQAIPQELQDAAEIDGCGPWRFYWSVVLPLSRPVLSTVAVIALVASWNAFLLPLLVLTDDSWNTLPLGVSSISQQWSTDYSRVLAYTVLSMVPALIFYALAERQIVGGLTAGAVKE